MIVLQPVSTTPEPTKKPWDRKWAYLIRSLVLSQVGDSLRCLLSVCCSPILCATFVCRAELVLQCCDCAVGCSPAPMRAGRPCAAVSAPSASDERCDSRLPHRRRRRRMRCQLWPMRWDCRSVRQAMQPAMNRGLFCSSARRRRLRQSARRHTDGACDSPCSLVLCAAGRRGQRDRCCRSRCATASSACLGRRGPYQLRLAPRNRGVTGHIIV